MNCRKARCGYTLVEMPLVVVILAIIGVLVVPTAADDRTNQLRAAAQILVADLEFAQLRSIGKATSTTLLVFDSTTGGYRVAEASDPDTPLTDPTTHTDYVMTFGSGRLRVCPDVVVESVSVGGDDMLGFGSYGGLDQTTAATITLACDGFQLTITIQPYTGEATIGDIL